MSSGFGDLVVGSKLNLEFHRACKGFDIDIADSIIALNNTLEWISKELAQSSDTRRELGANTPSIWPDLAKLWHDLARAQCSSNDSTVDGEGDDQNGDEEIKKDMLLRKMCISLAKFTRNTVAGVPENQNGAFENEPALRQLIHYHTSWSAIKDEETFPVTRILAQTISNIVTANEDLKMKLWKAYMNLPEDRVILIRLIASPDDRTVLAVLVLILNCIHGSKVRAAMLSTSTIGARVCVSLLDKMVELYDAEEATDGSRAFDIEYDIFARLITDGLVPDLYTKLSIPDEVITPHQTTLLKLVDSYLQSMQPTTPATTSKIANVHHQLSPFLSASFYALSNYSRQAIRRALGSVTTEILDPPIKSTSLSVTHIEPSSEPSSLPLQELDVILPKACEALVLVTQCIIIITLKAAEDHKNPSTNDPANDLRGYFSRVRSLNDSLVESLIDLLRLLDIFLPRINFGKAVNVPSQNVTPALPTLTSVTTASDPTGFSFLKRDLVRLLGILCHESKEVQDRVRLCGGIPVVMNLCVVDERNPYLREHAIFTLHNLLENNPENQAVVDSIKPTSKWENRVLHEIPGALPDTTSNR